MSEHKKVLTQALTAIQNPYLDALADWPRDEHMGRQQYDAYPVYRRDETGQRLFDLPLVEHKTRQEMVKEYAWAIPDQQAIDAILVALDGRPMIEIGAGTGYWAWLLDQCGVDVAAYDTDPPRLGHNGWHGERHEVVREPTSDERLKLIEAHERMQGLHELSEQMVKDVAENPEMVPFPPPPPMPELDLGVQTFHDTNGVPQHEWLAPTMGNEFVLTLPENQGRVLFLCWPPYDDDMADVALGLYTGDTFIYIGESDGGCTGDEAFFRRLYAEWDEDQDVAIPQWSGIHDYLTIFKRRETPLAPDAYDKRYE